jgi:VanZ family protein
VSGSTVQKPEMSAARPLSPARLASLLLPPLAVMAMIFLFSAQESSGGHDVFDFLTRKLAHVIEYTALTYLWWRAFRGLEVGRDLRAALAPAIAIALVYAASDEFHQTFVRGRHGTPVDVLIDAIGMAIVAFAVIRAYGRRRALGPSRPSAA